MNNAIMLMLGALSLDGCAKEPPADATTVTTLRSGAVDMTPTATVEEVRTVLLERRPKARETINALVITNDAGVVTLRGRIDDEAMRSDLVNRVRAMPNLRGVRDELVVPKK